MKKEKARDWPSEARSELDWLHEMIDGLSNDLKDLDKRIEWIESLIRQVHKLMLQKGVIE